MDERKKTHCLYRMFDSNGDLLYVGISCNPPVRIKQHSRDKDWFPEVRTITLESFHTRDELEQAEKRSIQTEHPKYNVMHSRPLVERADNAKATTLSEINRRLSILEVELRLLAEKKSAELPKVISKDQFMSVTGLSNGKFRILRENGILPEGSYQSGQARWFFQRDSVISFSESELCQKMLRSSEKDCETLVKSVRGCNQKYAKTSPIRVKSTQELGKN